MGSFKHPQAHHTITDDESQLELLAPQSFTRAKLRKALVHLLKRRGENLTAKQQEGIKRFKYQGSWSLGQSASKDDLRKVFDIFNDVFFNGLLTAFCKLEWMPERWSRRRIGYAVDGYCLRLYPGGERDLRYRLEKVTPEIWVSTYDDYWDPTKRVRSLLLILAHEMLHAFFEIYTCVCDDWNSEAWKQEYTLGHYTPWLEASREVKHATRTWKFKDTPTSLITPFDSFAQVHRSDVELLLPLEITLRRDAYLVADVQRGYKLPVASDLYVLDLDITKIYWQLRSQRSTRMSFAEKNEAASRRFYLKRDACIRRFGIPF
jgi:hypothetical protein